MANTLNIGGSLVILGVICAILYFIWRYQKLSNTLKETQKLIDELHSKREAVETFSKELASQIEHEVAGRLESNYTYDYLFENSLNSIIIAQNEDLKIIRHNAAASTLFNQKIFDYNILELFKDLESKQYFLEKINSVQQNKQHQNFRMHLQMLDSIIPVMVSIDILEFAQKQTLYFTFIDISDVAKLEEELQNKHLMLAQKAKEEKMGKMLGNIAHQWKQPLNALYLVCQNLKEMRTLDVLDDVEFDKYLQIMIEQIKFMSNTIDEFRAFYIPSTKKEEFEICQVIQNTLDLFYSILDSNISINFLNDENEKIFKINAIKNEFQNIIMILIDNAIEAVKERLKEGSIKEGKITIHCSMEENTNATKICALYIRDNGGGIPTEIAKKVFETFFTTKKSGTGIGLSIVQMFLESMRGKITFANAQDGVEFKVELPLK